MKKSLRGKCDNCLPCSGSPVKPFPVSDSLEGFLTFRSWVSLGMERQPAPTVLLRDLSSRSLWSQRHYLNIAGEAFATVPASQTQLWSRCLSRGALTFPKVWRGFPVPSGWAWSDLDSCHRPRGCHPPPVIHPFPSHTGRRPLGYFYLLKTGSRLMKQSVFWVLSVWVCTFKGFWE